ncbi:putative cystine/glutamate transporter [Apostichopus japonicus]|uniref:Putative cystine/glutamate transporter n=1 Tax=Stichopus japonicus TaxID=307972 RepID=A0A2G8KJQ2_STIJA|nr:putative cystine/glutamate transporter [Apostichopus japonicus]
MNLPCQEKFGKEPPVTAGSGKVINEPPVVLIITLHITPGNTDSFHESFDTESVTWIRFPRAFYSGLFAYSGWQYLPQVTEEILNPGRNVPLSIIIATTAVTALYLLTNLAYFAVLSPFELLASESVAVIQLKVYEHGFNKTGGARQRNRECKACSQLRNIQIKKCFASSELDIELHIYQPTRSIGKYFSLQLTFGQRVLGPIWWILPIFVAVSCIGSINGGIFSSARMFFVASREGQLPVIVSMIHINKRTPLPAAACMLPVCVLMLMTDDVYSLINYLSFCRWLAIAMTVMTVPYFRWKYPDLKRPFKVPLVLAILFALCAVFMVVASILSAFYEFLIGLLITVAGIPVYAVCVWWQSKPAWWNQVMEKSTVWMQKLLLVVPQERATYVKNF